MWWRRRRESLVASEVISSGDERVYTVVGGSSPGFSTTSTGRPSWTVNVSMDVSLVDDVGYGAVRRRLGRVEADLR